MFAKEKKARARAAGKSAKNGAGLALAQGRAAHVALDPAIDMEPRLGGDVAAYDHFGADEG